MFYCERKSSIRMICCIYCLLRFFCSFSNGFDATTFSQMMKQNFRDELCRTQMGFAVSGSLLHLCRDQTDLFHHASEGFHSGLDECRLTFENCRWNCTTDSTRSDYKLFGVVMARGSREAAVMFAMVSAGMVRQITTERQKGKREKYNGGGFNVCNHLRRPRNVHEYVNPRDCDADITVGDQFSQKVIEYWMDTQKVTRRETLMNEHNSAVGRLAVRGHMRRMCRCHGLSGACNFQSCYRMLQPLKASANWLYKQYRKAIKVKTAPRWKRDGTRYLVNSKTAGTPPKTDLIYLLDSPNYCQNDIETGSLGTNGRYCNASSSDEGSCDNLCCGRGYETHEYMRIDHCNCKFNWCCNVTCEPCMKKVTAHRCK